MNSEEKTDLEKVKFNSFFDRGFMAYSFSYVNQNLFPKSLFTNKDYLRGDRIILPPTCVEHLTRFEAKSPYQFRMTANKREIFCGVIEFTANEKLVYLPDWMMSYLDITEGSLINLVNTELPTCTKLAFQAPREFLQNYDPKTIVEFHLRPKTILSLGQALRFRYAEEDYSLIVLELEPADHVSLLNADINFSITPIDE